MNIVMNIRNSYWPTHYGALRLVLAAASLAGIALALGTSGHVTSGHLALGSHWN